MILTWAYVSAISCKSHFVYIFPDSFNKEIAMESFLSTIITFNPSWSDVDASIIAIIEVLM